MKTENDYRMWNESEELFNESDEYSNFSIGTDRKSPMHRKEKFREKDYKTGKKRKIRKRNTDNEPDFLF